MRGPASTVVRRVCTDSRQTQPGDLFFALSGETFDGHEFLGEAVRRGASAGVVERIPDDALPESCALVKVGSTRQALGRLAACWRQEFAIPVIAVAGSNGKTSAKDLIASVLSQKLPTLASEASFNNDIGVPLTLLRLSQAHWVAVLELGTNHPGELDPLIRMAAPRYGVITSIGREHLEFFRSLEGVAREEGRLAELLPASGTLFLNGDSEWAPEIARRSAAKVVTVGAGAGNEWRVAAARLDRQGVTFRVEGPVAAAAGEYRIQLLGRHQAVNALFAVALGAELGLGRDDIERGLAQCKPSKMRLQFWEANGVRVLDDSYNANADSALAALQTLQELPCKGRRVAVLGDMAELGAHSEAAHEEVGRKAAELGLGQLFAVGKMAPALARGARLGGLNRVIELPEVDLAGPAVRSFVKPGDVLLLKASRATRLERVAEQLRVAETGRKG